MIHGGELDLQSDCDGFDTHKVHIHTEIDYWLFFYCEIKIFYLKRKNIRKFKKRYDISLEKLYFLHKSEKCYYCNKDCIINYNSSPRLKHYHSTIDRVDPLIGYTDSNIVLSCYSCNHKKGKKEEEFVKKNRSKLLSQILDI